jgi:NDP-sugar pyrophosphorylase family protein
MLIGFNPARLQGVQAIVLITKAFIPVGGLGTRLYPLTVETSKAMVRFLNNFLINFIIRRLAYQGVEEFYLGVSGYFNYKALHDHLGGGFRIRLAPGVSKLVRIRYQPNEDSVGNAHSIRILLEYYKIKEPILVVQGDTVANINVRKLYRRHREAGAFMTIALKEIEDVEELKHFGVAVLDENGLIRGFVEKPRRVEEAPSRLVNTGIYVISEEMVEFLLSEEFGKMVEGGRADFGAHVIPKIIFDGRRVVGYVMDGYWFDIGTPERYIEASLYLLRTLKAEELEVATVYRGVRMQGYSPASRELHIDLVERAARGVIALDGDVLLGRHVRLEDNVRIANAIIDSYTIVKRGSNIEESVIMDRSVIGQRSTIRGSIIGRHVRIGGNVKMNTSYIGDNVILEDNAILENCKVWPHRIVKSDYKCINETIT